MKGQRVRHLVEKDEEGEGRYRPREKSGRSSPACSRPSDEHLSFRRKREGEASSMYRDGEKGKGKGCFVSTWRATFVTQE